MTGTPAPGPLIDRATGADAPARWLADMAGRHRDMIDRMLDQAHPAWQPVLLLGLHALSRKDAEYLPALLDGAFLPTKARLFAAFSRAPEATRYVLVGEGPYPREASATGVCFMDGAVDSLWSTKGLSTAVNRATSLRNFMKMLLVADGALAAERTSGDALTGVAARAVLSDSGRIKTLPELQENLVMRGFLLLNAALVFRADVPPAQEARAWRPFLEVILAHLLQTAIEAGIDPPTLVLWGKIAAQIDGFAAASMFPRSAAEHPYNLSFITNPAMQALFRPMNLLQSRI